MGTDRAVAQGAKDTFMADSSGTMSADARSIPADAPDVLAGQWDLVNLWLDEVIGQECQPHGPGSAPGGAGNDDELDGWLDGIRAADPLLDSVVQHSGDVAAEMDAPTRDSFADALGAIVAPSDVDEVRRDSATQVASAMGGDVREILGGEYVRAKEEDLVSEASTAEIEACSAAASSRTPVGAAAAARDGAPASLEIRIDAALEELQQEGVSSEAQAAAEAIGGIWQRERSKILQCRSAYLAHRAALNAELVDERETRAVVDAFAGVKNVGARTERDEACTSALIGMLGAKVLDALERWLVLEEACGTLGPPCAPGKRPPPSALYCDSLERRSSGPPATPAAPAAWPEAGEDGGSGLGLRHNGGARHALVAWLEQHADWPYPSVEEKKAIASGHGITVYQVETFCANYRSRHMSVHKTAPTKQRVFSGMDRCARQWLQRRAAADSSEARPEAGARGRARRG